MAQDDPKHTQRLNTIEYIEDVMFVLEYLERLLKVEGIEQFHRQGWSVTQFGETVDECGYEGEKYEQKDEDYHRVEQPFLLKLKIHGVVHHLAHKEALVKSAQGQVQHLNHLCVVIATAYLRQA